MKIAIVTLQLHTNYGGVLQAFALQRTLSMMGNDVEIIQLDEIMPVPKGAQSLRKFLTRAFRRYALNRGDVEIFRERRINREFPVIGAEFVRFFRKYMNIRYISSFDELRESDYDAFVVGSDQVWRPKYNRNLMNSYLDLTWKDRGVRGLVPLRRRSRKVCSDTMKPQGWDVKRIAYAVSFGSDVWEYDAGGTIRAACLARRFDALSFRELSGAENARKYLGVDSVVVPDPTLLLSAEDYLSVAMCGDCMSGTYADDDESAQSCRCLFEYILDRTPQTLELVHDAECRFYEEPGFRGQLKINEFLTADPRGTGSIGSRVQPSVESWIAGISSAGFVLTDSFHACVFSILFHRPFAVIGNSARGLSRIEWLLGQLGLADRIVSGGNVPTKNIDWEKVDVKLSELRATAMEFLNNNLR